MLWQVVEFLKDKSIAAVPKPWIKKFKNLRAQCYWPENNVESLRKRIIQPALKKNEKNFYGCKILLKGGEILKLKHSGNSISNFVKSFTEVFQSFQEALAAELKLTVRPVSRKKASYVKLEEKNHQSTIVQVRLSKKNFHLMKAA